MIREAIQGDNTAKTAALAGDTLQSIKNAFFGALMARPLLSNG